MNRILCLHLPRWPLQRLLTERSEQRQPPVSSAVIIRQWDSRRGDFVVCCSAGAWSRGVRPDMPLSQAVSLFKASDRLSLFDHQPKRDLAALTCLANWCERYSPLVGWKSVGRKEWSVVEPETLFLDITGIGQLFGGEESLLNDLKQNLKRRGLSPRLCIAPTVGAAWAVVTETINADTILGDDGLEAALSPLAVKALRLAAEQVEILEQLGIVTIGQLLQLPRAGLASRLGEDILWRLDQLLGRAEELIEPYHPPPEFQAEWVFEHPTNRRPEIEFTLGRLIERLTVKMLERKRGVLRLGCRLDVVGQTPLCFSLGLFQPTASQKQLQELLRLRLEQFSFSEVGRIELRGEITAELESRQMLLFDGMSSAAEQSVAALLERLSCRLGEDAVLKPKLRKDALPERQVRWLLAVEPAKRSKKEFLPQRSDPCHRPLFLISPLMLGPHSGDNPPEQFRYEGQIYRVVRCWGPERIETGWWRGRMQRRDYWRVESATGSRFWLFRDLRREKWFLAGTFA